MGAGVDSALEFRGSASPRVSVVTSVFNGEQYLRQSAESILNQQDVDLEWIVVEDGSTDATAAILKELAQDDARVRVVPQSNQGLTSSLIMACRLATADYIARHDADDCSRPGRLRRQVEVLRSTPGCALVASHALIVGPRDEPLYESRGLLDPSAATTSYLAGNSGPVHGSVMYRRQDYFRAGEYRDCFRFAQDQDLWLRLLEQGHLSYVDDVLYLFRISENSVSANRKQQQQRLADIARQCRDCRERGASERTFLDLARAVSAERSIASRQRIGGSCYFIGRQLLRRRDQRAIRYLYRSLRNDPWHWQSWLALASAMVSCRRSNEKAIHPA